MIDKLPKRHHYIPQFYLKGFSIDEKRLHLFDKKDKDKKTRFRYQSTEKIAFENNLYTFKTKDLKKGTLEQYFSQVEGEANKVIKKLLEKSSINDQDRANLSLFVAFLYLRTPSSKKNLLGVQEKLREKMARMMFSLPKQKERMKQFFKQKGEEKTDKEIDDLIDFAKNPKRSIIKTKFAPEYWIKQMLTLSMKIAPDFEICGWEVKHTVRKFALMTSDDPVMLIPSERSNSPWGIGLRTPGVKKVIPLSSRAVLIIHGPTKVPTLVHTEALKPFSKKVNEWTMRNSERFVFSPDIGKLERIAKTRPDLTKPKGVTYRVS